MILTSDNGGYVKSPNGACVSSTARPPSAASDHGHGTACFNGEAGANNWPLRGGKYSMFEGGIRVTAFASGGYLPRGVRGTKLEGMMHVADWSAAGPALRRARRARRLQSAPLLLLLCRIRAVFAAFV